ncbi:MAG: hypothetical protein R2856_26715 [Caldilineaceae bacterium]
MTIPDWLAINVNDLSGADPLTAIQVDRIDAAHPTAQPTTAKTSTGRSHPPAATSAPM